MKKNILGAIVILFLTVAFLLIIDDISKDQDLPDHATVEKTDLQSDLVGFDEK